MKDFPYQILVGPLPYWETLGSYINAPFVSTFIYPPALPPHNLSYFPQSTYQSIYTTPGTSIKKVLKSIDKKIDLILWCDHKAPLPPDIADSPCPIFLLVFDWHERYLALSEYIHSFDHIFGDRPLVELLRSKGVSNVSQWYPYSFFPKLHFKTDTQRPIDVSFAGRFSYVLYHERNQYLKRLLEFNKEFNIEIKQHCYRNDYNRLLNQSKIVFNHSIRGEMNQRAYEAAACGSLLFLEDTNQDVRYILPDKEACVLYNTHNFEELITYYLKHDCEREALAQKGHKLIQTHTFERNFESVLEKIPSLLKITHSKRVETPLSITALNYLYLDLAHLSYSRASALEWIYLKIQEKKEVADHLKNALAVSLLSSIQLKAPGVPENGLDIAFQTLITLSQKHPNNAIILNNLAWVALEKKQWSTLFHTLQLNLSLLLQLTSKQWSELLPYRGFVLPLGTNYFYQQWQQTWQKPDFSQLQRLLISNQLMLSGEYAQHSQAIDKTIAVYQEASNLTPDIHILKIQLGWAKVQKGEKKKGLKDIMTGLDSGIFDLPAWQFLLPLLLSSLSDKESKELKARLKHLLKISYFAPLRSLINE